MDPNHLAVQTPDDSESPHVWRVTGELLLILMVSQRRPIHVVIAAWVTIKTFEAEH